MCIAQSQAKVLVGEVTIKTTMVVAVRHEDGTLHPEDDSQQACNNFLLNPMNMPKHGIEDFRILDPWVGSIYAWVLEDVMPYSEPIAYLPRQGAVIFVKLDGRVPSDSTNKAPPIKNISLTHVLMIFL